MSQGIQQHGIKGLPWTHVSLTSVMRQGTDEGKGAREAEQEEAPPPTPLPNNGFSRERDSHTGRRDTLGSGHPPKKLDGTRKP